jgi:hypothetical protein
VGQEVDVIEPNTDDGIAALRLFSDELIAELVILQELVAKRRDAGPSLVPGANSCQHDRVGIPQNFRQPCPQLQGLEVRNVLPEVLVHVLLVLLERREFADVILGYNTAHFGFTELDDALAQVAQVLEQVVVVGIDKFPLKSQFMKRTVWSRSKLTPI